MKFCIPVPTNPTTVGGHLRKRRFDLEILQAEAAEKLGVCVLTVSRWECDIAFPPLKYQPRISAFLGSDPFADPRLERPKSNETSNVAFLGPVFPSIAAQRIASYCADMRMTFAEFAEKAGICPVTIENWYWGKNQPRRQLVDRVEWIMAGREA